MTDLIPPTPSPYPRLEDIAEPITAPIVPGPPDLIPGLLPTRGQLVIAGVTDVGKTLVALEICSSLVTGNPLWGHLQPTRKVSKIVYVLGEHYNDVLKRLWRKTELPMSSEVWLLGPEALGADKWLVAQGKQSLVSIQKFRRWMDGADLVVFDPFSAFVTGVDAENDNLQMRLVLDSMSLIAQSAGASCLVLAHQGKPSLDHTTGKERHRKSYAIRGASAIEDAATNIFYMGRAEGDSEAAQKATDQKIIELTRRKYKGEAPERYRLIRDSNTLCHTLLGNRPFVEVQKIAAQAKVAKYQAAFPDLPFTDCIKAVAVLQDVSETTIRRYLGLVT